MWTVNSTTGLSYTMPVIEEYKPPKRFVVRGFTGIMRGLEVAEIEIPYECPNVCSTGSGLISVNDYE